MAVSVPKQAESETTTDRRPSLHERILKDVEGRILSGEWPPGHRIPFEHELTLQYGCSRMTVNKALTDLVKRGLIERRRKSGSYVMYPHTRSAVLEIRDIKSEVEALGLDYGYECLMRTQRKATVSDRLILELRSTDEVLAILARHSAGGQPFCLEERLINLSAVPEAAAESFSTSAPGPWLIGRVPWSAAEHKIRAVVADKHTAGLLGLGLGAACLIIERRTRNNGRYVTHVKLTYSGDRHELVAEFAPTRS